MTNVTELDAKCTACGYKFDSTASTEGHTPVPDAESVSICIACANVDVFTTVNGKLGLRPATVDELRSMLKDRYLVYQVGAVRVVNQLNENLKRDAS